MKSIALVGAGPTTIYTLMALLERREAFALSIFERLDQAGVGMPYCSERNHKLMLANIASVEIPAVTCTLLQWLKRQQPAYLAAHGVDRQTVHDRQFLPRVLLGAFFREQFERVIQGLRAVGCAVQVHERCNVLDIAVEDRRVRLICDRPEARQHFDQVIIATGHDWPAYNRATPDYYPSPWSGLLGRHVPAAHVGVLGTSLSAVDAVLAVVSQHGRFNCFGKQLQYVLNPGSEDLRVTLLSRTGVLREADFYYPVPGEPLGVFTEEAVTSLKQGGRTGLLDRLFALMVDELQQADPLWCRTINLLSCNADTFSEAYFAARVKADPFEWAERNLVEVQVNQRRRHTVPWRYTLLRLHEVVQVLVPHLEPHDRRRFQQGLYRVFVDNYAAIPPHSIERLLALRRAGVIEVAALGKRYRVEAGRHATEVITAERVLRFDAFIDARGQQPLASADLPFPSLRERLLGNGQKRPQFDSHLGLKLPGVASGQVVLAALPYLMHVQPFIQGINACADMGEVVAAAIARYAGDRPAQVA